MTAKLTLETLPGFLAAQRRDLDAIGYSIKGLKTCKAEYAQRALARGRDLWEAMALISQHYQELLAAAHALPIPAVDEYSYLYEDALKRLLTRVR